MEVCCSLWFIIKSGQWSKMKWAGRFSEASMVGPYISRARGGQAAEDALGTERGFCFD